ncbi:rho GDP-dissociation inhibitor 2-like [Watersipora subatra]|uniref:rho GDP-dissociation inhibitor 2-like n=1 Tax=Watersipora subatra TaxID=2589382 RepID=UPI00355C0ABC
MAESEENAPPVNVDDDDVDTTPGYKPPAEKSMDAMLQQDTEDESLQKYKAQLLGSAANAPTVFWPEDPRKVIVKSISLVVEGRADAILDLTGDLASLKEQSFSIKEGTSYRLKIHFCVQREIVTGLKLVLKTSRKGIKVDTTTHMVGSYGPKEEAHSYQTPVDEAPSGMIMRGAYKMACCFTDDDKHKYLEWNLTLHIKKDWE